MATNTTGMMMANPIVHRITMSHPPAKSPRRKPVAPIRTERNRRTHTARGDGCCCLAAGLRRRRCRRRECAYLLRIPWYNARTFDRHGNDSAAVAAADQLTWPLYRVHCL